MKRKMNWLPAGFLALCVGSPAYAAPQQPRRVELMCHRTANEDVPENTLDSLEEAALLGCDVVEVDVRRTLDGKPVLNHDGFLERLTDGVGQVEDKYYEDLQLRDAGSWMGDRFRGLRIPLFEEALRLARENNLRLYLDMKDKGMGADVLQLLKREGMLDRVHFGGEWDDVKALMPHINDNHDVGVQPGVTVEEVTRLHREGKFVIANFSANGHGMDLAAMKSAVAAGVDCVNTDYPRLGADAVGRPVERRLAELAQQANSGDTASRTRAILALSHYRGFALQAEFAHWLLDSDANVSRAAALALVMARPGTPAAVFADALRSGNVSAQTNAAWALGQLKAPASMVTPLLRSSNPQLLEESLIALSHMPGDVDEKKLLQLLQGKTPAVRAAAAVALSAHHPDTATAAVTAQMKFEVKAALAIYDDWKLRGKPPLSDQEKAAIVIYYRSQVKEVQALFPLKNPAATRALEELAFRSGKDFAEMTGIMSAFQLWDRVGDDPQPVVAALSETDAATADRAEWILIHGGPAVLPEVRRALTNANAAVRERAIRILAWQGDMQALPLLNAMKLRGGADDDQLAWAIEKIQMLHPKL